MNLKVPQIALRLSKCYFSTWVRTRFDYVPGPLLLHLHTYTYAKPIHERRAEGVPLRTNYTRSPSPTFSLFFFSFFLRDSHGRACEHRFSYAGPLIRARSRRHPVIYCTREPPVHFYIQITAERRGWKVPRPYGISLIPSVV